jgi:hypothetical protein
MAKSYRIPIPISLETKLALQTLADASNSSIGATAGSFLDELAPHFLTLAKAFAAVKTDPLGAVRMVNEYADSAREQLDEEQLELKMHMESKTK